MTTLYQFFNTNGYAFEMLIAVALFCWWLDKRPRIILRGISVVVLLLAVSMLWSLIPFDHAWLRSLRSTLFYILCIYGGKMCCEVSWYHMAFYATAAGAAQHFSFQLSRMLSLGMKMFLNLPGIFITLAYPVLSVAFLILCYCLFGRELKRVNPEYLTKSPAILLLLAGMQLSTNVFMNLFDIYSAGAGYWVYTIYGLFDVVCCLFLLSLQCEIAKRENERQSNEILNHLLYQQKQQMMISKETMDLIHIKCHDIKNQIALLGNHVSQEEMQELKHAIDIYDMAFKTGNEALDILMMEKLMQCERKNIRFDCMAEGENLFFMKPSDIYSLIGNAVDNAIEAVDKIADVQKRYISVKIRMEKDMMMIHFENYYEGELTFENDLPQTTKQDKRYHGFGMKSIRMITERYKGYLSVKAHNGIFTLNILLPVKGGKVEN